MVVYIVGAGPGDIGLVTLRAKELVQRAEVIIYDKLANPQILEWAPADCEFIYMGKREKGYDPSQTIQKNINEEIVKYGKDKFVVRLKGGDPLIFGRGGEEAKYLKEHGIKFEIVPGVTSGIAAPTYAGIPCTDRNKASFLMFITGHKAREKKHSTVPWDWVAKSSGGTLVIYMGVGEIANIVKKLTDGGMSSSVLLF